MAEKRLSQFFRRIPFLDLLFELSPQALWDVFGEVFWTTIAASFPLWLMPFVARLFFQKNIPFLDGINSGEVFVYSEAIAGPLLYVLSKTYDKIDEEKENTSGFRIRTRSTFPHGNKFFIFILMICLVDFIGFLLLKCKIYFSDSGTEILDYSSIAIVSDILFFLTTALFFFVTVSRSVLQNFISKQKDDEKEFSTKWEKRKHEI